jgi:uncharacterized protein YcfJ
MSFSSDVRDASERFPQYVEAFKALFRKYNIASVDSGWKAVSDPQFRDEAATLGRRVMEADGGKVTFTVLLAIVGAALGGVGVAALGGAIGVSMALVLAIVGLVVGNELDSEGYTKTFFRKMKAFMDA